MSHGQSMLEWAQQRGRYVDEGFRHCATHHAPADTPVNRAKLIGIANMLMHKYKLRPVSEPVFTARPSPRSTAMPWETLTVEFKVEAR